MRDQTKKKLIPSLLKALRNSDIIVNVDYTLECAGVIEGREISVNPLYGDRILSLLHEYLHYLDEGMDEDEVEQLAIFLLKRISIDDEFKLLLFLRGGYNENKH